MSVQRNMYGCYPCPMCRSHFRAAYAQSGRSEICIECDDCGLVEPAENNGAENGDWGWDAISVSPSRQGLLSVLKQRAGFAWLVALEAKTPPP